ncbi:MAG: TIGR00730 family Rossman fold protein [Xanthobacteraceae bacterium]
MNRLHNICVYCGSSAGNDPAFAAAAEAFGQTLAKNDIGLVYGGGSYGLMGILARAVCDNGGRILGVIPDFLKQRELLFEKAQEIIVTRDMHERKRIMFERADAFVALPGGIGTLEELVEQLTWAQLGHHAKPILLVDINSYWQPLLAVFANMEACRFIHSPYVLKYHVCGAVDKVLPTLRAAIAEEAEPETTETAALIERM